MPTMDEDRDFTLEMSVPHLPKADPDGWIRVEMLRAQVVTRHWNDGRLTFDSRWTWRKRLQVKVRFALERMGIIDRPEMYG